MITRAAGSRCYPLLAVLTVALVSGCQGAAVQPDELGRQSAAIVNGAASAGYPAVGALVAGGTSACSATLIAPQVALTAAHCVHQRSPVFFYHGGLSGVRYSAASVVVHPGYAGGNVADLALVHLTQAVKGVEPLRLASRPPTVGEPIVIVGYGDTEENAGDYGTKRVSNTKIGAVTSELVSYFGRAGNVCDGDSGGPALARRQGVEELIGVHSTKGEVCGDEGNDIRVDTYRGWIDDNLVPVRPDDDSNAPRIEILSPADQARVGANLWLNASASDNVAVRRVALYIDGEVAVAKQNPPFEFRLEALALGQHRLELVAEDGAGNASRRAIEVEVTAAAFDQPFGGRCSAADDCQSRVCTEVAGATAVSFCSRGCSIDAPCRSGYQCIDAVCQLTPNSGDFGQACVDAQGCSTGLCASDDLTGARFCSTSCDPAGDICPSGSTCRAGDGHNVCIPGATNDLSGPSSGCAVGADADPAGALPLALALLGLLLIRRRR